MTIRKASSADLPALIAMGRQFLQTVYPARFRDDPAQLETFGHAMLTDDGQRLLLAAEDADRVIGMIGLVVYPHPMSGDVIAAELFWWVDPEHRGSASARLLRRAESWARVQGATVLQMVAPNADVATFYERIGFDRVETVYHRGIA